MKYTGRGRINKRKGNDKEEKKEMDKQEKNKQKWGSISGLC